MRLLNRQPKWSLNQKPKSNFNKAFNRGVGTLMIVSLLLSSVSGLTPRMASANSTGMEITDVAGMELPINPGASVEVTVNATLNGASTKWRSTSVDFNNQCFNTEPPHRNGNNSGTQNFNHTFIFITPESGIEHNIGFTIHKETDCAGDASDLFTETLFLESEDEILPLSAPTNLHRTSQDGSSTYQCDAILPRQTLLPTWEANIEPHFSHYEYTSYNPGGVVGINEQRIPTNQFVHNWIPPADGTNGFKVRAVDQNGNKSEWSEICYVTYDSTAPVVAITNPIEGQTVSGFVDIAGLVSDNIELSHYNLSLYPGEVDLSDGNVHTGARLNDPRWCTSPISGTVNNSVNVNGNLCTDWDTTQYNDGEYQVRLAARDKAQNRDLSDPFSPNTSSVHIVAFTIENSEEEEFLVDNDNTGGSTSNNTNTSTNNDGVVLSQQSLPQGVFLANAGEVLGDDAEANEEEETLFFTQTDEEGEVAGAATEASLGGGMSAAGFAALGTVPLGLLLWWLLAALRRRSQTEQV